MRKIVLLASTGQVGFELNRGLAPLGEVITINRSDVDFLNLSELIAKIEVISPQIIVNASAYTAVDKAETDIESATKLNAELPAELAKLSAKLEALLVHYSTDYVYPGTGETPWQEYDSTEPVSVYGKTKLAGDEAIIRYTKNYLIFRTSWVYAARGNNFLKTMLKLSQIKDSLNVVNDQVGAPTPARLIAQVSTLAIYHMLSNPQKMPKLSGVYHLAPLGTTNWYEFAGEIFTLARKKGIILALQDDSFKGIATEQYPTPAKRPKNSRMNMSKIQTAFGIQMPDWQSQLKLTFEEYCEYTNFDNEGK